MNERKIKTDFDELVRDSNRTADKYDSISTVQQALVSGKYEETQIVLEKPPEKPYIFAFRPPQKPVPVIEHEAFYYILTNRHAA